MPIQHYTLFSEGPTGTDPSNVFCAVNLHNQSDVYRFGIQNGMCYGEKGEGFGDDRDMRDAW